MEETMSDQVSEGSTDMDLDSTPAQSVKQDSSPEYEPQDSCSKVENATGYSFRNPKLVVDAFNNSQLISQFAMIGEAQLKSIWVEQNTENYLSGQPGSFFALKDCEVIMSKVFSDARLCTSAVKHNLRFLDPGRDDKSVSRIDVNVEVVQAVVGLAYVDSNRDTQILRNVAHCLDLGYNSDISENLDDLLDHLVANGLVSNRHQRATAKQIDQQYKRTQKSKFTKGETRQAKAETKAELRTMRQLRRRRPGDDDMMHVGDGDRTSLDQASGALEQTCSISSEDAPRSKDGAKKKAESSRRRGKGAVTKLVQQRGQRKQAQRSVNQGLVNAMNATHLDPCQSTQGDAKAGKRGRKASRPNPSTLRRSLRRAALDQTLAVDRLSSDNMISASDRQMVVESSSTEAGEERDIDTDVRADESLL